MILISDGRQSEGQAETLAVAAALRGVGAVVYTLGLGADVDRTLLEAVAGDPARYLPAPRAGDLAAVLRAAGDRLLCGR
ncbi:MAG: VWA domain-containing protein [Ardenticatenia bacterium]|nr:VWA domain-containing protein [Ardenticatenia bacterium]